MLYSPPTYGWKNININIISINTLPRCTIGFTHTPPYSVSHDPSAIIIICWFDAAKIFEETVALFPGFFDVEPLLLEFFYIIIFFTVTFN